MRKRKNLYIGLTVASVLVFGVIIAYAALSTTLNVSFSGVTQSALSWNVGFTGTSATPSVGGTSSTGRSCGTATISGSSVSVGATTLSKPGDYCRYTLTIKNSGSIGATIGSVVPLTKPPGTNSIYTYDDISYSLATNTANTEWLKAGTSLPAGSSKTVYLIVEYVGNNVSSSTRTHSGEGFKITFNQA